MGADKQTSLHRGCGTAAAGAAGTNVVAGGLQELGMTTLCHRRSCWHLG